MAMRQRQIVSFAHLLLKKLAAPNLRLQMQGAHEILQLEQIEHVKKKQIESNQRPRME